MSSLRDYVRQHLGILSVVSFVLVVTVAGALGAAALGSRPRGIGAAHPATATASPRPRATSTAAATSVPVAADWTQYRADVEGTGVNPEGIITSANVGQLTQQWSVQRSPGFYSTPAVVGGIVYVTTGASLYAFDMQKGLTLWHFDAPDESSGGIHSSVAVDPKAHLALFGTPEARVYAVDTTTGQQRWRIQLADPNAGAFLWSSPLVANGKVYIGIASQNDDPCVRGAAVALDEATGKTVWQHYMVAAGTLGGSVWSSMSADPDDHEVIATTGNPCPAGPVADQADAIVAMDWDTGATRWQYTALANDTDDFDFGEGPVIFTFQGQRYVIAGNKYGKVYALVPQPNGSVRLAWSNQLAISDNGKDGGGIFEPPAYQNGIVVFAGGPPPDHSCGLGSLQAFRADTGKVLWKACTDGRVYGPAAISGGVIFVPQDHKLAAYRLTTGKTVWVANWQGPAWGGVAVSHGHVVAGTVPGTLYCYGLPSAPD